MTLKICFLVLCFAVGIFFCYMPMIEERAAAKRRKNYEEWEKLLYEALKAKEQKTSGKKKEEKDERP